MFTRTLNNLASHKWRCCKWAVCKVRECCGQVPVRGATWCRKRLPPSAGRWLTRASITGTILTGSYRRGSLPWFILAALVSFLFFPTFLFACVDEDSLLRNGALGSADRKAFISVPALQERVSFLKWLEGGFWGFWIFASKYLSKRFVCPHCTLLGKVAAQQNIFWLVLPIRSFHFWGEEELTPWLNYTKI